MNNILLLIPIVLSSTLLGINFFALVTPTTEATGGAGEIKGLIDPIIERAITALQQNNTELALEEIETLKNELDDTFSTDEKEDD